jgi:phosphoserine phosphatase
MPNLVVQGLEIATSDLKMIANVTGAVGIERISATAFRLREARVTSNVASICEQSKLDFAYVPVGRKLSDYKLLVMDMDSTLISIECIDEIADLQGIKPQVAQITAAAMRGEIDYTQSLERRMQLLAGLPVDVLDRVYRERLRLNAGAEAMLASMRNAGLKTLLVSGGFRYFTSRLKASLGLDAEYSNEPEIIDGCLTGRIVGEIVDGDAKARIARQVRTEYGLRAEEVIGIGDGANDLPFLTEAGVSIAYHAKSAVRLATTHCLDFVGLDGVVPLFE